MLPAHRSRFLPLGGRHVLDDCYNANPGSMAAALATRVALRPAAAARTFAVLGDMLELGEDAEASHRELGRQVAELGYAGLVALGAHAAQIAEGAAGAGLAADRVLVTQDPAEAAAVVAEWSGPADWILVKASRALRLERVLEALQTRLGI